MPVLEKGEIEKRVYRVKEFRARKDDDGSEYIEGYSAVFDSPSEDMGWGDWEFREFVDPGAFDNVLKNSDARALINHDPNLILARESSGTLKLKKDEKGLFSEINVAQTSYGKDLLISVSRGDIKEQSFSFIVLRDRWEEDRDKKITTRTILEIKELYDISPVTYPAYPDTDVAKRSFEKFRGSATPPVNEKEFDEDVELRILEKIDMQKFERNC